MRLKKHSFVIARNFKIDKSISISYREVLLSLNKFDLSIFNEKIDLKINDNYINLVGGIICIENFKIVLSNKYPIGICYDTINCEINSFQSFGSINDFSKEIISNFSDEMNKYFLNMSGIEFYRNYDSNYLNKSGLIQLKENIDKHLYIMANYNSGVILN